VRALFEIPVMIKENLSTTIRYCFKTFACLESFEKVYRALG